MSQFAGVREVLSGLEFDKKHLIFVFINSGEKLSFSNDNIVVHDADGAIKFQTTCYRIFALFIVGNCTITSGLLGKAHKFCFPIFLLNSSMKIVDSFGFKAEGNFLLREKQYQPSDILLAKHIVANKMSNQQYLLRKERTKSEKIRIAIKEIGKEISQLDNFSGDVHDLMGAEGRVAKRYFSLYFDDCAWCGRHPRIKDDYLNSTLDIGYSLLFNYAEAMLRLYGFDLYKGVLHTDFYMRKSLVCDIVEPFRVIVDKAIRNGVHLGQVKPSDFHITNGAYLLKREKNKDYILLFTQALINHKQDIFNYVLEYYRAVMKEKPANEFPIFLMEHQ